MPDAVAPSPHPQLEQKTTEYEDPKRGGASGRGAELAKSLAAHALRGTAVPREASLVQSLVRAFGGISGGEGALPLATGGAAGAAKGFWTEEDWGAGGTAVGAGGGGAAPPAGVSQALPAQKVRDARARAGFPAAEGKANGCSDVGRRRTLPSNRHCVWRRRAEEAGRSSLCRGETAPPERTLQPLEAVLLLLGVVLTGNMKGKKGKRMKPGRRAKGRRMLQKKRWLLPADRDGARTMRRRSRDGNNRSRRRRRPPPHNAGARSSRGQQETKNDDRTESSCCLECFHPGGSLKVQQPFW